MTCQWRDDDGVLWEATLIGKRGDNLCVTKPKRVPDEWQRRVELALNAAAVRSREQAFVDAADRETKR